jgi:sigma54-dependent transcription regulator
MRERHGLVGAADGGTLFLDAIGELPEEMQAHLLRLRDDGEYHRLGDYQPRRVDVRFVGATNREDESLKNDLTMRIAVPGLDERRYDVPLLVRSLLRRVATSDPDLINVGAHGNSCARASQARRGSSRTLAVRTQPPFARSVTPTSHRSAALPVMATASTPPGRGWRRGRPAWHPTCLGLR